MLQDQLTLPLGAIIQDSEGGRYLIEDLLGQGGFSAVYLVRERRARQTRYALKEVIDPDHHERSQLSFEAGLLRRLSHRALPRVYQVFEDTQLNRIYMLMDYIQGKDLEQLRREQPEKRFSLALTLTLLNPIVDALTYLHTREAPIIHRDIKPSNIIIPINTGEAMLVDFGLAKEYVEDKTTSVFRYGTPGYAAPEQYGQGTNIRTDIYALGATIYTLLTGKVPTDALTRTMEQTQVDPLKSAHTICPSISPNISNVIAKAMSLRIEDRYASIEAFWQALSIAVVAPDGAVTGPITKMLDSTRLELSQQDIAVLSTAKQLVGPQKPTANARPLPGLRINRTYGHVNKEAASRKKVLLGLLALILIAGFTDLFLATNIWKHQRHSVVSTPIIQRSQSTATPSPIFACKSQYAISPAANDGTILASCYTGTMNHVGLSLGNRSFQFLYIKETSSGQLSGQFVTDGQRGPFTGAVSKAGEISITVTLTSGQIIKFTGTTNTGDQIAGKSFTIYNSATQSNPQDYGDWTAMPYQGK
ncbi:serine/threonine protein kinase [Dictyobacter aurantiacus]|uniref:non-specific serine/threonine protein kinase n=1 Tax=Dictyobacter aurantiacus TaxID=1936993 RepID=A0A401ZCR9_9CHLR|nr:serine/threonine-protein kinase [Dictyobacter aurantiacus]GCE04677.1 hypothetical protein KDAU_20060 [Dictyobacter aurantiacus]